MAFCRDISSNESRDISSNESKKIPIPGISNPREIPNVNNLRDENPEMQINSGSRGLKFRDTKNFYTI